MTDASPELRCRRLRDAFAEWSALCAEGDRTVERLLTEANAAVRQAPPAANSAASARPDAADAGEWSKLVEELESRLAEAVDAELAAREETRRLEVEVQELRRARRDLERDSRNVRHELENLKASLDEAAEEREFARRRLESRVEELEAENRRLLADSTLRRGPAPPPAPDESAEAEGDDSPVRRALKSLGKKP